MRYPLIRLLSFIALVVVITGCTSGKLAVSAVDYQSIRTDFAQPDKIPQDASIAVEYFFNSEGVMQPVVYNLTDEVLILDQTKSFVILPNGTSVPYYDPTVRTSTTSNFESGTQGASFNLGGITRALGVGGVLGRLADATTVGSSSTAGTMQQNTVLITDQPQVFIGPRGSVAMSKAYKIDGIGMTTEAEGMKFPIPFVTVVDAAPKASPIKFSVCVTYSLDDGATYNKMITNMYVSSQIDAPVSNKKVSDAFYQIYKQKPDALVENMYMFVIQDNIDRETTDVMGEFITHDNVYDTYVRGSLIDFQ